MNNRIPHASARNQEQQPQRQHQNVTWKFLICLFLVVFVVSLLLIVVLRFFWDTQQMRNCHLIDNNLREFVCLLLIVVFVAIVAIVIVVLTLLFVLCSLFGILRRI